ENWEAPLYWKKIDKKWWNFTLSGLKEISMNEPVTHISYYEAEAFARWKDARLPTEFEWEVAAKNIKINGNFVDKNKYHPTPCNINSQNKLNQMYGDVWEWTQSAFLPYPGFKSLPGALGEYNGKFMSGQMVLRGGSCATYSNHIRKTYRNFFPPHSRWQFMGLRLAKDI
ncbi:MAG: ergothioneine biosynthesis protein EgtB, partial [Ignavibacteriales bacterium CG12_big_fil_rev_8_21_14_0_65_30_8]